MKNTLLVIVVLLVTACATTSTKPVKEFTKEDVIGAYEAKTKDGSITKRVFFENGTQVYYFNGAMGGEQKWSIVNKELHVKFGGGAYVFTINEDKSITNIAEIEDGKRKETPKENQSTFKKIK